MRFDKAEDFKGYFELYEVRIDRARQDYLQDNVTTTLLCTLYTHSEELSIQERLKDSGAAICYVYQGCIQFEIDASKITDKPFGSIMGQLLYT